MPLFSIIIPIYGVENYLRKCLDSILNQTFRDFEAILVDDGSMDSCPKICDEYAAVDDRLIVIHKSNGGLVSARQAGAKAAKGDYLVCVDGDDWIGRTYLEEFANVIFSNQPDVIVCGSKYCKGENHKIHCTGWKEGFYDRAMMIKHIFPSLIQASNASYFPKSLWAKCFKSKIYKQQQMMINTALNMGEDSACTIPIIYHSNTLYILDSCEYYYRINPSSMCNVKKPLETDSPRLIHEHICHHIDIDEFDFKEQLWRKTTHELFSVIVSLFFKRQSYFSIRKEIIQLIKDNVYHECIEKCHFKGSLAALFMAYSLKCRITFPIFIYSKFVK